MHDPFSTRSLYRSSMGHKDLVSFRITEKESDLHVQARTDLAVQARKELLKLRKEIEDYMALHPAFQQTLKPWPEDSQAPLLVQHMIRAARLADVGPMAAIAGAIAEALGKKILRRSPEVIVENGGDLFVRSSRPITLGLYAGDSPFSGKIGFIIPAPEKGMGVCTSSGTMGHSLSFGRADAAVIISPDAAVADAFATAVANRIQKPEDIDVIIENAKNIREISGMVLVKGDRLGAFGSVEIIRIPKQPAK